MEVTKLNNYFLSAGWGWTKNSKNKHATKRSKQEGYCKTGLSG